MAGKFRAIWDGVAMWAATQLTPVPVPKVPKKQTVMSSYLTATPDPESRLPATDRRHPKGLPERTDNAVHDKPRQPLPALADDRDLSLR